MSDLYRTLLPMLFTAEARFAKVNLEPGIIIRIEGEGGRERAVIVEGDYRGWITTTYFSAAMHLFFKKVSPLEYLAMQGE